MSEVKSLGPRKVAALEKAGLATVADLLHHVPRTYLDRTDKPPLAGVPLGTEVTIIAEVKRIATRRPRPKFTMIEALISDDTASLKVVWFNQNYREKQLPPGTEAAFSGTVESFRGSLQMSNPVVEVLDGVAEPLVTGRVVPVYSQVGGVKTGELLRAVHNALKRARPIPDPLPDVVLATNGLMSRDAGLLLDPLPRHRGPVEAGEATLDLRRVVPARAVPGHEEAPPDRGRNRDRPPAHRRAGRSIRGRPALRA